MPLWNKCLELQILLGGFPDIFEYESVIPPISQVKKRKARLLLSHPKVALTKNFNRKGDIFARRKSAYILWL